MDPLQKITQAESIVLHFRKNYESKKGIRWAIILKEDKRFVGTIGLNNLALGMKKAEIGFEIHPEYWRSGITSEALKAVLEYSFKELGLHRMGAVTFPANVASIGLLKKHGFQQEGFCAVTFFKMDSLMMHLCFHILQNEWITE